MLSVTLYYCISKRPLSPFNPLLLLDEMQSLQSFTLALFALVAFALVAFASPLPTEVEKRTTHTGRVCSNKCPLRYFVNLFFFFPQRVLGTSLASVTAASPTQHLMMLSLLALGVTAVVEIAINTFALKILLTENTLMPKLVTVARAAAQKILVSREHVESPFLYLH